MSDLLTRLTGRQPTLQPLPEDRDLEQFFTDAEHARRLFEDLVMSAPLPKHLLVIHGVGGVGKSTLLRVYRLFCYRQHIPAALVGAEEAPSAVHVMASWASDLSSMGVRLRAFPTTFDHYRALQAKVETRARKANEVVKGAAGELGKAAARTAVEMAASAIPVVGPLAAALGGAGTEAAIDWLRGLLSRPDLELYLDPSKQLTEDFLGDLARAAARQRIVLMVDTYEQMTALDEWTRELARRLPENVLFVIAGRTVPEWDRAWPGWMGRAEIVELQEMSPDDLRTLVNRYYAYVRGGQPDPEQVDAIVEFSRGLPIAAATVVQLWVKHGMEDFPAVKPQVVADLADRLLEGVPPDVRPAFEVAAVLRYFNADVLRALLGDGDAAGLYAELRRWPFVRPRREGLAVHSTIREMINEDLCMRTPERFRALHERATVYYEARIDDTAGDERERMALERLYHRVCIDEEAGMRLFREMADDLVQYRLANRLRTLLNDAHTYPIAGENSRLWQEYYGARLAHLEARLTDAEKVYQAIGEHDRAEPRLRAYALCDWGQLLSHYERLAQPGGVEKAKSVLERSLSLVPLDPHLVRSFFHLARVQRYEAHWDEQTALLEKAKEFFEQRGDEYGLVYVYSELERGLARRGLWRQLFTTREKLEDLSRRLPKSAVFRSKILIWNWSWALAGRLSRGERDARECIRLSRSLDDTVSLVDGLRELGWILGHQGRYGEADRSFSESVGIARELSADHVILVSSGLGFWGAVRTRQGETDQANDYLSESLRIKRRLEDRPGILEPLVWLGRLREVQGDLEQAQGFYEDCLHREWYGLQYWNCETLSNLARVRHARGEYDDVLPLLTRAERLAQRHEYNDHLASLRLTQGHIAWAGAIPEVGSGLEDASHHYQEALVYALRYNRFLLDEVLWGGDVAISLKPIIPHCLERGAEGRRMLIELRDWWQTGTNDIGAPRPDTISPIPERIPLLQAERFAREREPGDGSPQTTVIDRIEQALK